MTLSAGAAEYTDCISAEGIRPHPNPDEYHGYDTKLSDSKAPVILELWGMQSTPLLPSLQSSVWPGVIAIDKVLSLAQIEVVNN